MKVKTDTKEKFHVISVQTSNLSGNMAAELSSYLLQQLQSPTRNIVLNLKELDSLDKEDLLELMNITATESEAWDIVQMEEIERELMEEDE